MELKSHAVSLARSLPADNRVRSALIGASAFIVLVGIAAGAHWLRHVPAVRDFVSAYPGQAALPEDTPVGFPSWLGWQHFFNTLIILLLIHSGWLVRTTQRPQAYWTRNNQGLIRTKGVPRKISFQLWFHLNLGALFALNGAVFYVLLFATGQWKRIVPAGWDVFPNALSVAIQYASLDWPTEHSWVAYNALQLLAYFVTVFIAAPLAIFTGLRMSGAWPANAARLNRIYPIEVARAVHFPVMLYFVAFLAVHVTLVFATGMLANLNHMYAMRDGGGWLGFGVCMVSLAVIGVVFALTRPLFLRPVAALTGTLSRR